MYIYFRNGHGVRYWFQMAAQLKVAAIASRETLPPRRCRCGQGDAAVASPLLTNRGDDARVGDLGGSRWPGMASSFYPIKQTKNLNSSLDFLRRRDEGHNYCELQPWTVILRPWGGLRLQKFPTLFDSLMSYSIHTYCSMYNREKQNHEKTPSIHEIMMQILKYPFTEWGRGKGLVGGDDLGNDLLQLELRACRLQVEGRRAAGGSRCGHRQLPSIIVLHLGLHRWHCRRRARTRPSPRQGSSSMCTPFRAPPHGPALQRGETSSRC
jgi:hypothetical protein